VLFPFEHKGVAMKQLLGKTIWIVLLSLVVIVFVLIYGVERSHIFSTVDSIPFLTYDEKASNNQYMAHEWNVINGIVMFENKPVFKSDAPDIYPFVWDGKQDLIFIDVPSEIESSIDTQSPIQKTFVRPKTPLSIQRILRPGLHIQISITDHGNHTQATAEYYGYKHDKYTLRPNLEDYKNAVLIRPLDAIEIEATTYVYFQFAWLENNTNLKFGVVEGKLSKNLLDWRVITDDIGFQETGKGSNCVVCQDKLWFSLLDGSLYSISVKKGIIQKHKTVEEALTLGAENNTQAELYRFQNALLARRFIPGEPACTILVIENNKITNRIEVDKDFVTMFHSDKKSMYYQLEDGMRDPRNWFLPLS
jgi:hypothetical protein